MPQLQEAINRLKEPHALHVMASSGSLGDTTHAKSTLGVAQVMGPAEQKVLGVMWDVTADLLVFSVWEIAALADVDKPMKRRVTTAVRRFYDPLGFLSPVVVKFKMFFKELCGQGLEWDQELTGELRCKCLSLSASLQELHLSLSLNSTCSGLL